MEQGEIDSDVDASVGVGDEIVAEHERMLRDKEADEKLADEKKAEEKNKQDAAS